MPFGLAPACTTPTRLADGFGHAQVALFAGLSRSRNSPQKIGSPVFTWKFGVLIHLHQNYNLYCRTSQRPFSDELDRKQPDSQCRWTRSAVIFSFRWLSLIFIVFSPLFSGYTGFERIFYVMFTVLYWGEWYLYHIQGGISWTG
jgi:hypothetical protein